MSILHLLTEGKGSRMPSIADNTETSLVTPVMDNKTDERATLNSKHSKWLQT